MLPQPPGESMKAGALAGVTNEDIYRVPENINFSEEERKTLNFWNDNKVFEQCLQQSKGKPRYYLSTTQYRVG